jgi:hypothetical protein
MRCVALMLNTRHAPSSPRAVIDGRDHAMLPTAVLLICAATRIPRLTGPLAALIFASAAHPGHYPPDMAQQSATLLTPTRGPSRFRLAVKPSLHPLHPYGWEIYDDDRGEEPVLRSARRFRSPKEAWEAGSIALEMIRARFLPSPSPASHVSDELP